MSPVRFVNAQAKLPPSLAVAPGSSVLRFTRFSAGRVDARPVDAFGPIRMSHILRLKVGGQHVINCCSAWEETLCGAAGARGLEVYLEFWPVGTQRDCWTGPQADTYDRCHKKVGTAAAELSAAEIELKAATQENGKQVAGATLSQSRLNVEILRKRLHLIGDLAEVSQGLRAEGWHGHRWRGRCRKSRQR